MFHTLRLYAEIYRVQLKNNWVREAVYRTNFLTSVTVDVIWIFVEVSLFTVLYSNVSSLGGWTKPQVFFFLGIFFSSDAIFYDSLPAKLPGPSSRISSTRASSTSCSPSHVHPVFLALSRWINITAVFNFFLGMGIAIRYAGPAGFKGGLHWLLVPVWLLVGLAAGLVLRFLFSIWIFWTERSWALSRLYYQFFAFASKPDSLYPRAIRYVILTVLPFGFIGSVSRAGAAGGLRPFEYFLVFGVIATLGLVDAWLWRIGLRRYRSASS